MSNDIKIISKNTPAVVRVGNNINPAEEASDISINDTGDYYDSGNVNGALQEAGADLATKFDTAGRALNSSGTTVNVDENFDSKQYDSAYQALSIDGSGNVAWDMSEGQAGKLTLDQDAIISNPTNKNSITPILEVKQDATGGRTLTFASNFVEVNTDNVTTDANSVTVYAFIKDSAGNFRGRGQTFSS